MNLFFKTFLIFCNFNIFCGCCIYDKNEKNTEINKDNENEKNPEINNDDNDDKPPVDDDKRPVDPNQNKNITRRPSYFTWSNGNCAVQVFCLTFIMIFKDNPEGLKLLEDSNILFFQKVASMVKNYINYKKTGIKGNTLKELQEVYKEYCRFLVNESLKYCDKILKFFIDNQSNLNILNEIHMADNNEKNNYDKKLVEIVEEFYFNYDKFESYINRLRNFANNYNLETAKNYDLNVEKNCIYIDNLYNDNMENYEKIKSFLTYYKNDFTKDLLKTIEKPKSYGFGFYIYFIFDLLKKYIPNINYNEKFKYLDFNSNINDINNNTIFITLECGLGANLDISKKELQNHVNCIYKDIDGKWWYAYGYNEEFLIDENLIKQKKFKEIVANNFGTFHYTFFSVNDFINIKI